MTQSASAQPKCVGVCLHECGRMCRRVRACAYIRIYEHCAGACMHMPRAYACMHTRCAGACLHVIVWMCVAWVRVRMFPCAGVFAHVRAHAYVLMRGCVCACVVRPTYARVYACLRARARMRRVHVHARSRVGARARKCKCPHERMRLYMCVGVRRYVYV